MERLSEEFTFGKRWGGDKEGLRRYLGRLQQDIEKRDQEIARRLNWLLERIETVHVEMVAEGNTGIEQDGNWKLLLRNGDFFIQKRVSGTWTDADKIHGS